MTDARLDLRLAPPALAAWAGAYAGPGLPPRWVAATVVGLVSVAAVLLVPSRSGRSTRRGGDRRVVAVGVAAALVCAAAGLLAAGVRAGIRAGGPVAALAARRGFVSGELVVRGDPVPRTGVVVGARRLHDRVGLAGRLESVRAAGRTWRVRVPIEVVAAGAGWLDRTPGERLAVRGRLVPAETSAATLHVEGPPVRVAGPPVVDRVAGRLRRGLRDAVGPLGPAERGLLPGLVVGDTTRLDPALRADFRTTGLTHLVAVSGTNCAIVLAAAVLVARRVGLGRRGTALVAGCVLVGFVVVARPSPSVLRAAATGALGLAAAVTGRERDALRLLCAAVLGLLLVSPELARAPGFALSCAATTGLLVLAPPWRARLARRWPAWLADLVAVPLAAQVACAPLVAALAGSVSLVAVPANVLAVPAVGPATVCGVIAAVTAPVAMPFARIAARAGGLFAAWLVVVARHGAALPLAAMPVPRGPLGALVVAAAVGIVLASGVRVSRRGLGVALAGSLVGAAALRVVVPGWPPPGWSFAACDVGQGDALVLRGAATVVVDAGPDPQAVDGCLRDLGIRRVTALVLTHYHADHVEGMPGVLRRRTIGEVVVGPLDEPIDEVARVAGWAGAARIPVRRARSGERWRAGDVELLVVAPAAPFRGTASDPNNSSLVVVARVAGLTVLLTGDVEEPAQRAVLAAGAELRADVVKVPHHGSARQVAEFLSAAGARVAVVSAGRGNPYGHPAPSTLALARAARMRVHRTDRGGDLAVASHRGRLTVAPRGRPRPGAGRPVRAVRPPSVPVAWWCPLPQAPGRGVRAADGRRGPPRRALVHRAAGPSP